MGMVEDVDDYRQQLKGYKAQATGMGIVTNDGAKNMDRMAQSIQRSTATALESERIGTEVIEDLNWQRERISGARDRLQEAHTGEFLIFLLACENYHFIFPPHFRNWPYSCSNSLDLGKCRVKPLVADWHHCYGAATDSNDHLY